MDNSIDLNIKMKGTDTTITLPQQFTDIKFCRLEMAQIKNLIFNINTYNQTLYMMILKLDAGTTTSYRFQVSVPVGFYTENEICTYLNTAIPAALLAAQPTFSAITVSCTFDSNTQLFTITETSANYKNTLRTAFWWSFIIMDKNFVIGNQILSFYNLSTTTSIYLNDNYENSLNYTLGYYYPLAAITLATPSPYTYSYISDEINRLNIEAYIYVCTDLVMTSNYCWPQNTSARNILACVPLVNFGSSSIYEPTDQKIYPTNLKDFNQFRIWFLDSNFKPLTGVNFTTVYHNIKLRFFHDNTN